MDIQKLKFHLILSAFTLLVVFVLVMMAWGSADEATNLSAANVLKVSKFDGLPDVWHPSSNGDASPLYEEAFDLYASNKDNLNSKGGANPETVQKLIDLLVRAKDQGSVTDGFADTAPLEPGAQPSYANAPRSMANLIDLMIVKKVRDKEMTPEQAEPIIQAIWAMGQRLFINNLRSFSRESGLSAMHSAYHASGMIPGTPTAKAMATWIDRLKETESRWMLKKQLFAYDASVGDLVRLAQLDEDRTFRLEAILQMGVARWTKPTRGNVRAISSALNSAMYGSDPLLAKAAKAANSSTREQVRVLH